MAVAVGVSDAELLKVEIMQLHDCAKYIRICAKFGLMNAKQEKMALISHFCGISCVPMRKNINKKVLGAQKNSIKKKYE